MAQCTSATVTNATYTVYWTVTSGSAETKEQKKERLKKQRRAITARKWYERAMARADAWFAAELVKIEAEAKANEWRPHVSYHDRYNSFALAWWTLGQPGVDEFPGWRRERIRYQNKWCGITISNISRFEQKAISAFVGALPKRDVYHTGNQTFSDHDGHIGTHMTMSTGYWFRHLDDHNRFAEMLEALPKRTAGMLIANEELTETMSRRIRGKMARRNYYITSGEEQSVLTIPDNDIDVLDSVFDKILGVKVLVWK